MYPKGLKRQFHRTLVSGSNLPDVSSSVSSKWIEDFNTHSIPDMSCLNGRHLNTFSIGSDPEFCFTNGSHKIDAATLGLRPALAFGADQNQRLVELRPSPSRSVVEHVASLLATLRWMVRYIPDTLLYPWRCGAYFDGDGMGGHVHFGRKRPTRADEVAGLDGLARTLRMFGMFPNDEWDRRAQGDTRHQVYGQYGDIRPQAHGYEYRTLPSWLRSPTIAFAVITLSKLVVLDPGITRDWNPADPQIAGGMLLRFCKFYAGLDDDARILYNIFLTREKSLYYVKGCFKEAWGFVTKVDVKTVHPGDFVSVEAYERALSGKTYPKVTKVKWDFVPSMIWPTPEDVEEIRSHLVTGYALAYRETKETFSTSLPKKYAWLFNAGVGAFHRPGFGDFFHDLVVREEASFQCTMTDRDALFGDLANNKELRRLMPEARVAPGKISGIHFHRTTLADLPRARAIKKILLSGEYPIWTVKTVQSDSYDKFKGSLTEKPKKANPRYGKEI